MIESHLQLLGFNDKEVRVFLSLTESGAATAREISSRCQIPRSTVYTILDALVEGGFVMTKQAGGSTTYRISSPSSFLGMLEEEKERLEKKETAVRQLVDLLRPSFTTPESGIPRIQFFSGKESIEKMLFSNYRTWRKSIAQSDFTWWGYQDVLFVEQYRKWLDPLWKSTLENEHVKLFSNHSQIEVELSGKVPRRFIKPLPSGFEISSTIWILGEYIVMISTHQKPHYAFQLVDRTFASNLKNIFEFLWNQAQDLVMAPESNTPTINS